MKREGFQHGMVRTFRILPASMNTRPMTRLINERESPSTAGLFTRVSSKPTNHSKFTGKCARPRCAGCHSHPVCKAKGKSKGTHKLNSFDLLAWKVGDARPGSKCSGLSASAISDHLLNRFGVGEDYSDEVDDWVEEAEAVDNYDVANRDNDDDDELSFCDVVVDLDQVTEEDEDWCLVEAV